ncbi:hypothetical protein BH10BDE1_BH10BDE1_35940 [soil metagenome]
MSSRFDAVTLAGGRVLQSAILFLTYRELTHLLPKSEVGLYFFLLAITGGIGLIVINPAGTFLNRFIHKWQEDGSLRKNLLIFSWFTVASSLFALLITEALPFFGQDLAPITAFAVGIFVFGSTLSNTFLPALNLLRHPRLFVFLTVGCQSVTLIAVVAAAKYYPEASVWLGVAGLVNVLFAVVGFALLSRLTKAPSATSKPVVTPTYWSFAWPLMLANTGIWFLTQGYRPVAQHLFGLEALAVIGLGLGLASSIGNAFETLAQQLFLPKFYENSHQPDAASRRLSWESLWSELIPMYFAVAIFVTGFSAALVRVLSPTTYADAWVYLSIGAWIEFFRMSGGLVSLLTFSELKTKNTIRPFIEGALITLCLMFLTKWIAVSILIGNIYALLRLALKMKHTASLLAFSPKAGKLIALSLLFLIPIFFRSQFDSILYAFLALAFAGPIFLAVLLRNSSWSRAL